MNAGEPDANSGISLRTVGRSALLLAGGSAAVQVVGVARELFVAAQVGLSRDLDALLIALVLPVTLSGVLTSGTIAALVPAYLEARTSRGLTDARRLAGVVLMWAAFGAILLAAGLALFAGPAVSITGPGLSSMSQADAVGYLRLLAPVAFLVAVSAVLTSCCQAEERFATIALASLAGPLVTLAVLVVLWRLLGLSAYALGMLLGQLVSVGVLLVATIRASIVPLPGLTFRALGLRAFLRHAGPLTLSAAILQLNMIVDRVIASLIAPGAVSALRYGEILVRTPIVAVAPAWSSALYSAQVRAAVTAGAEGLGRATSRSAAYAFAVFIPIAVLAAALAPLAVDVVYKRGAFDAHDVAATANVTAAFAPLILILMVSPMVGGAHNARRRGIVLLAAGTMNVIMNSLLDVLLGAWLGVAGVALASSLTSTIVFVFLAHRLAASEDDFSLGLIGSTALRSLAAVAVPAALVAVIAWSGFGRGHGLTSVALLIGLGVSALALYVAIAMRAGVEEVSRMVGLVAGRLGPLGRLRTPRG